MPEPGQYSSGRSSAWLLPFWTMDGTGNQETHAQKRRTQPCHLVASSLTKRLYQLRLPRASLGPLSVLKTGHHPVQLVQPCPGVTGSHLHLQQYCKTGTTQGTERRGWGFSGSLAGCVGAGAALGRKGAARSGLCQEGGQDGSCGERSTAGPGQGPRSRCERHAASRHTACLEQQTPPTTKSFTSGST